jgi:hypothetical protein
MTDRNRGSLGFLVRFVKSRYTWYIGGVLLLILAAWLLPRRYQAIVSVENRNRWDADEAPPRREIVWEQARTLDGFLAGAGSLATPRLTDKGATLYFTRRSGGQADICRARFLDGRWQAAQPVEALNSPSDDLGPILNSAGSELYFYSNRPGGVGGFDLYIARRSEEGWSKPANLGPAVNTPAHEYDPAISPDGQVLVFASNRTRQMIAQASKATGDRGDKPWSATIRAHPGLTQFDLYLTHRDKADWAEPCPIAELNRPQSNEGAPFFSPGGGFLYFASDRPHRQGEAPNLDLYRSQLVAGKFTQVENLGATINTAAHETEPALSPEGFRLVFASDRDGTDRLYESNATEVIVRTDWDTSHWSMLVPLWWKAILPTLVCMLVLLVLWYYNEWLLDKVTLARFVIASSVIHAIILLLLWLTPLPEVITQIVESMAGEDAGAEEVVVDNAHQQSTEGAPAFETVADLAPAQAASVSEVDRQVFPGEQPVSSSIPRLKPTLPATQVQALPPERVVLEPTIPRMPTPRPKLSRQPTRDVVRVVRSFYPIVQPVAEARPSENPLQSTRVTLAREKPASSGSLLPRLPSRRTELQPPQPVTLAAGVPDEARESPVLASTPSPLDSRPQSGRISPTTVARASNEPRVGVVGQASPKGLEAKSAAAHLERSTQTGPDATPAERPTSTVSLPPAKRLATGFLPQSVVPAEAGPSTTPTPKDLVRRPMDRLTVRLPAPPDINPGPVAGTSSAEKPLTTASVDVLRSKTDQPEASVPVKPTRLPSPLTRRPVRTGLGATSGLESTKDRNDPALTPLAGPLMRQGPGATRVALAHEPVDLRRMFALRSPEARKELAEVMGGMKASEEAVERGLVWIAQHQNPDGSWSLNRFNRNCKHRKCSGHGQVNSDTAGTALALLPFLGAGYTHRQGKYQDTVERGLKWLLETQKDNGDLLSKGSAQPMYSQGLATIVLCEAYGMTNDPRLKDPAQKAIDFIVRAQSSRKGGWRYRPGINDSDTSVMGWQMMALKSGEMAGLTYPEKTIHGIERWLASVEGNKPVGGVFGYQGRSPSPAMTAQGLLCLQFLGRTPAHSPRLQAGIAYLARRLPKNNQETSYYWYLATQVMYHMQGDVWRTWEDHLREILLKQQIKTGSMAGTWNIRDNWERAGGRLYATSLRLLMLEVRYRHLPLYRAASFGSPGQREE